MFKTTLSTILLGASAFAQAPSADKTLAFDAASIKPAQRPTPDDQGRIFLRGPSGGPGTGDPGRFTYPYMTLKDILKIAYNVKNYQINGPAWLDAERFDITATMPPYTTREQFRIMLQNLLNDRFKMTVHKETKELPMYSLIVNRGGPKMKESVVTTSGDSAPRPGMPTVVAIGRARVTAIQQTMQDLANRLMSVLDRPVIDDTGLTAKYDFVLTYAPDLSEGPGARGPGGDTITNPDVEAPQHLFGALQSQLGLKLEPRKGNVEVVVIDKMEKMPTEN